MSLFCRKKPVSNVIAFDGPERVGKSTQIELLKKHLISKKKKVLVLHSSEFAGKDITNMPIPQQTKNVAYFASLWDATIRAIQYLKDNKEGVVIFDRHVLTQVAFVRQYSTFPFIRQMNHLFLKMVNYIFNFYGNHFYSVCLGGVRYGKSQDYVIDKTFYKVAKSLPNACYIGNGNRSKEAIHEEIKKILGV